MTFWEYFARVVLWRPRQALAALYWHLTRRRVRATNRLREASAELPFAYHLWIKRVERNHDRLADRRDEMSSWTWHPRFSVVIHGERFSAAEFNRSMESIEQQLYPAWTVNDRTGKIGSGLRAAMGDFVVLLRAGDRLSQAALFHFADALQRDADAAILYGDQDEMDNRGRRMRPWFKPRWNEELFFAQDYLSSAIAIESSTARQSAGDGEPSLSELVLAATALAGGRIVHVPHILCHVVGEITPDDSRIKHVARHLNRLGATATAGPFGTVKVEWPLPANYPLVSILVPTRDKVELLRLCIESVRARTDYNNFEILIIDNDSVEKRTLEYFREVEQDKCVRIVAYSGPFNFSAINNFAVRLARGSYVCLLNNDTEVLEPAWLSEMMRYAVRSDIGAVGAKLLYEDGSIQHAGVVVGIGNAAGHAHRFSPGNLPGYFKMPHITQFVSAVTAACLVVEKKKFESVGGLDEKELAVAFNDVDFCLKLQSLGWHNVYVPHAVLVHHESKSRGRDTAPAQIARYRRELAILQERWSTTTYEDPLHNPNFDRYNERFVVRL